MSSAPRAELISGGGAPRWNVLVHDQTPSPHRAPGCDAVTNDLADVVLLLVLAFGVVRIYRKRRQRSAPSRPVEPPRRVRLLRRTQPDANAPWPYIRGTDLYRRSLENLNVAPFARQAQGLPLYHEESQWRDPPG